jgi:ketosteroid isomerase-like protein
MPGNSDALHPVYAEWGRGNWEPRFEVYAPDMEWGWSAEFPSAGVTRDPHLRSRRLREWLSPWEEWRCEAEDYVEHGEWVVVLTRYSGRGKGSGVAVETRGAHVWKFADGKAVRLEVFADRARALESVGIEVQSG